MFQTHNNSYNPNRIYPLVAVVVVVNNTDLVAAAAVVRIAVVDYNNSVVDCYSLVLDIHHRHWNIAGSAVVHIVVVDNNYSVAAVVVVVVHNN